MQSGAPWQIFFVVFLGIVPQNARRVQHFENKDAQQAASPIEIISLHSSHEQLREHSVKCLQAPAGGDSNILGIMWDVSLKMSLYIFRASKATLFFELTIVVALLLVETCRAGK